MYVWALGLDLVCLALFTWIRLCATGFGIWVRDLRVVGLRPRLERFLGGGVFRVGDIVDSTPPLWVQALAPADAWLHRECSVEILPCFAHHIKGALIHPPGTLVSLSPKP